MRRSRPGFTLVEILMVVALIGVVVAAGLAPTVFLVERLRDLRNEVARRTARDVPMAEIFSDARSILPAPTGPALRVLRADRLDGTPDDALLVYGLGSQRRTGKAGTTVYRTFPAGIDGKTAAGLYRFDRPYKLPGDVNPEELRPEEGNRIGNSVRGLRLSVFPPEAKEKAWSDTYEGAMPEGLRVRLVLEGKEEALREDLLPVRSLRP
jgi:prepilin-type N-terminal cleavage/methylation domain-containing protein